MEEIERIPISYIKQYTYCKRRFALMYVDNEWGDNYKIVEGDILHKKVDDPFIKESRGSIFRSRSVPVYSELLNIQGVCDIVEFTESNHGVRVGNKKGLWEINPIEYKNGKPEKSQADFCQLCATAICLEEMFGISIPCGDVYYGTLKRRKNVEFTSLLRQKVLQTINGITEVMTTKEIPPKPQDQNCNLCSLCDICMPNIFENHTKINRLMNELKRGAL